jgi:serine/threonine protein kinase
VLIDDNRVPRLCDFGRSKIADHSGYTTYSLYGTARYTAPELHSPLDYDEDESDPQPMAFAATKEADVYAFAMLALNVSQQGS